MKVSGKPERKIEIKKKNRQLERKSRWRSTKKR